MKGVSKRIRFEVFKRDKFTCQYCGQKAPDVVLHVDHVTPRAAGGKNDILNLVTSCAACNLGKGARELADDSAVAKQRAQMESLQERQEQLRMLIDWQRSLVDNDNAEITEAESFWCGLADWYALTEAGRLDLRKLIRKHGLAEVLEAMREATGYFQYDDDGNITKDSTNHGFNKIGGICRVRAAASEKPYLRDLLYLRGVLRNKLSYVNERDALAWMDAVMQAGGDLKILREMAFEDRSWTSWKNEILDYLTDLRKGA